MNKVSLFSVLFFVQFFGLNASAQESRIIRDVILLDVKAYEVLMTENGQILSKIRHIPAYLDSEITVKKENTRSGDLASTYDNSQKLEPSNVPIPQPEYTAPKPVVKARSKENGFKDSYEITFKQGTATLSSNAIRNLNELALALNSGAESEVVHVFGFHNEPALIASLLSKRRRDACIAYLKIKGVQVNRKVSVGSITKGTSNKIVFGFE